MKKTLSLFSANLLYVLSMLLVLLLGSTVQSFDLAWGVIVTELALIALPTLLFLRWQRVPFKTGLRLNPVSPVTAVLCVILGVSMSLFGLVIEGVMAQLTGLQSVVVPTNLLPDTTSEMVVYFVALAIAAPICEELLFRGALQGAYENHKSARFAITVSALMFAFYHFRLSGLPALLPIAFVLGYVAWRTGSIYAAILIHLGNNSLSALNSIRFFGSGEGLPFIGLLSGLVGALMALVILLVIKRLHPKAAAIPASAPAAAPARPWLAVYWPLLLAALLYVGATGAQAVVTSQAGPAPAAQVEYGLPSFSSPVTTRYEIANRGGEPVGEMTCLLEMVGPEVGLTCECTVQAYEYREGQSFFADGSHRDVIRARWDPATMALLALSMERDYGDGAPRTSTIRDGVLTSVTPDGAESVALDEDTLVEFEWAWRLSLLKANSGDRFSIPFASLLTWNEQQGKSMPLVADEVLLVGDEEDLSLSGQIVPARKLAYGPRAAWHAREDATAGLLRPAKFDDGMLIYTMQP